MRRELILSNNSGGFTLIEMMTSVVIAGLTILLLMTVLLASINNYHRQDTSTSASRSADLGMEYLAQDIRSAKAVLFSYGSNTTSDSSIVIQSPAYSNSGIITGVYDYISYKVDNQHRLLRTVVAGGGARSGETDRVLATNISSLTFTYLCHNEFQGNGSASTFNLSHIWVDSPTVTLNGVSVASGYSFNSNNGTITFSPAPASGTVIEVSYPVSPSDSSALADVQTVNAQLRAQLSDRGTIRTAALDTTVRLRNKE